MTGRFSPPNPSCTLRDAFNIVGERQFRSKWTGREADHSPDRIRDKPKDTELRVALSRHKVALMSLLQPLYTGQIRSWFVLDHPEKRSATLEIESRWWPDPRKFSPSKPVFGDVSFNVSTSVGALKPSLEEDPFWHHRFGPIGVGHHYSTLTGVIEIDIVALKAYLGEEPSQQEDPNPKPEPEPKPKPKKNPVGRPRESSPFRESDAILIQKMRDLINEGKATSPHNAAETVANEASGGGSFESKVKRLRRLYFKLFQNESE